MEVAELFDFPGSKKFRRLQDIRYFFPPTEKDHLLHPQSQWTRKRKDVLQPSVRPHEHVVWACKHYVTGCVDRHGPHLSTSATSPNTTGLSDFCLNVCCHEKQCGFSDSLSSALSNSPRMNSWSLPSAFIFEMSPSTVFRMVGLCLSVIVCDSVKAVVTSCYTRKTLRH